MSAETAQALVEVTCPECDGNGYVSTRSGYQERECWRCDGAGWFEVTTYEVEVGHYTRWEGR